MPVTLSLRPAPALIDDASLGSWMAWVQEAFTDSPARFWHSRTAWHRASTMAHHGLRGLGKDRLQPFVFAALLHDIGRAIDPQDREPHAFVGARFLEQVGMTDAASLVAHHSGARHEAELRGQPELDLWLDRDVELLAVLTYIDRTTNRNGEPVTFAERRRELADAHGADSMQVVVFDRTVAEAIRGEQFLRRLAWA